MKKVLIFIVSVLAFATANAAARVGGIQYATPGDFSLGIMLGIPPAGDNDGARMPMISLDGNWGVASGFINTSAFGQNGAIDLGFYYGICAYKQEWEERGQHKEGGILQNAVLFRAAFHFQFVENLDVYGGISNGVNIWSPTGDAEWDTDVKYAGGMFFGGKYYFSDVFGVKAEFPVFDWNEGNLPAFAAGVSFNF
ncbi:MAG: hypothetical protein J6R41_06480 [Paludibacteraceae bacterium]|nr:hypothetical protein [Paludibacteraceae bacterium]